MEGEEFCPFVGWQRILLTGFDFGGNNLIVCKFERLKSNLIANTMEGYVSKRKLFYWLGVKFSHIFSRKCELGEEPLLKKKRIILNQRIIKTLRRK